MFIFSNQDVILGKFCPSAISQVELNRYSIEKGGDPGTSYVPLGHEAYEWKFNFYMVSCMAEYNDGLLNYPNVIRSDTFLFIYHIISGID